MLDDGVVKFDGIDLSTIPNLEIVDHDFNQMPQRDIKIFKLARQDKSIITSSEYSQKNITIDVLIRSCTRQFAEQQFNKFKARIQLQNRYLEVAQAGTNVRYVVTLNSLSYKWVANNFMITFEFIASDPIGQETTTKTLFADNITMQTATIQALNEGSYDALPTFTLILNSVSDGGDSTISLINASTGYGLQVLNNYSNGDVLTINVADYEVRLNGDLIDYVGVFPKFGPGQVFLSYADSFTARSVALSSRYNVRFS